MKRHLLPFALLFVCATPLLAQVWEPKAAGVLPANYNVADICIVNEQVIWAVAFDYHLLPNPIPPDFLTKVLKSTDGGETWTVKDIIAAQGRISWDIHAFDENTACITTQKLSGVAGGRGIFRTTDGGETWTEVFSNLAGGGLLHFFDAQEGVCWLWGWGAKAIARTTDGGATWTSVPAANIPTPMTNEGHTFSSASNAAGEFRDKIWFGTTRGRILKTENRGETWTISSTGLGFQSTLQSMGFRDDHNGLAVLWLQNPTTYEIVRTSNGGLTWEHTGNFGFLEVDAIPCANTFMAFKYWDDKSTAVSNNFGTTWTELDSTTDAAAGVFRSPQYGWMIEAAQPGVGAGPALYKWIGNTLDTRIYVNRNATGANTGASWADAYTDLQAALAAAQAGDEIWVAEGTYTPAAPGGSQNATFTINKNLKLYGGFAGTECYLGERDIELYPTILSGDLNGDDVPDDFSTNRGDNVMTVVTVEAGITPETVIDGFTISNGHADGSGATTSPNKSGGGLYSSGAPLLTHCIFQQNYAEVYGGGAYFNYTGAEDVEVSACSFGINKAVGGGGLNIENSHCRVSGCTFMNNMANAHGGGMRYTNDTGGRSIIIIDCVFENNQSSFGGGLRLQTLSNDNNFLISDCDFTGNAAVSLQSGLSQGGGGCNVALFPNVKNNNVSFHNNRYIDNTSSGNAAGCMMGNAGDNSVIDVANCMFAQNRTANNGSGFWISCTGEDMDFKMKTCRFIENIAENASAAADFWGNGGGTGTVLVDSSLFESNVSFWSGAVEMGNGNGGIGTQINYQLTNSTFINNEATEGGAIAFWCDAVSKADFILDNCIVDSNVATIIGGGLAFYSSSTDFKAKVSRTRITNNHSVGNGGALGIYHVSANIPFPTSASCIFENCLIAGNTSTDATIWTDLLPNLQFLNSTIANNSGGGIQLSDKSGLTLQNTILHNPGYTEYEAVTDDVTFNSQGGNLIGDGSLAGQLLPSDKENLDPLFAAPGDYRLSAGSPCIDMGVNLGNLPVADLAGYLRVAGAAVDIGAYEYGSSSSAGEISAVYLALSPNPAADFVQFQLSDQLPGSIEAMVFDAQGRPVRFRTLQAGQPLEVQDLPAGLYTLRIVAGERAYAGRFVKQ